jgi:flagellar assembly protein FliH
MQFERITLKPFTAGVVVNSDVATRKVFVPQYGRRHVVEEPVEELPPPPPTFSEAELQAAREEGYRNGFNDGEKKGLAFAESEIAMVDKNIHALMQPIADKVVGLFVHYDQFIKQQKQSMPSLAFAIAKKVAGEALQQHALANIEHVSMQCIDRMLGEPELHIYVHPTLSDALEAKLIKHFAGSHEPGDVLIHKDEALDLSACRIEWKHGGLNYNPSDILAEMERTTAGIAAAEAHMHEEITVETALLAAPSKEVTEAAEALDATVEAAMANIVKSGGIDDESTNDQPNNIKE